MANVHYYFGNWTSAGPANDFLPGQVHRWIFWGFDYGDAVSITAHPIIGPVQRFLTVENIRTESHPNGRQMFFDVRNVGNEAMPGYGFGITWISD